MIVDRIVLSLTLLAMCLGCGIDEPAQAPPPQVEREESPATLNEAVADSKSPAEIIQTAIESHGGESNFAKANIGQTTMTIEGDFQPGIEGKYTKFDIFDMPNKHKRTVKGEVQGQKIDMNYVMNGNKGWNQVNGGEPIAMPVDGHNQSVYPNDNLGVLLALQGAEFELSIGPMKEIEGQPAYRIRMETDGQWVGDSFFDKETNLLVGSRKELFDNAFGKTRVIETYYSDYKVVDGLSVPMQIRTVVDGDTTATIKVTEVKFMTDIDESVFAKPLVQN